jgi:hypothetical protein
MLNQLRGGSIVRSLAKLRSSPTPGNAVRFQKYVNWREAGDVLFV